MKSILDPSFRYRSSVDTDLRRTFARIRRQLSKQKQSAAAALKTSARVVVPLREREAGI